MDPTIFYAWLSDLPEKYNRYLIRDAARKAAKAISTPGDVEDSPRVDHDTRGIAGSPAVAETIFQKIETCSIFVADVTPIAVSSDGKHVGNPNVMIELGFAASAIGWERIICIMNTAFGKTEQLPFDLIHRRFPIQYCVSSDDDVAGAMTDLAKALQRAFDATLKSEHLAVLRTAARLDATCLTVMKTSLGGSPGFSERPLSPNPSSEDIVLRSAIPRLLDLGLIRTLFNSATGEYSYNWTYLGKAVLNLVRGT